MNWKSPDSMSWPQLDSLILSHYFLAPVAKCCIIVPVPAYRFEVSWRLPELTSFLSPIICASDQSVVKNSIYEAVTLILKKNLSDAEVVSHTDSCNTHWPCICSLFFFFFYLLCWIYQVHFCQCWLTLSVCMTRLIKFFNNKGRFLYAVVVLKRCPRAPRGKWDDNCLLWCELCPVNHKTYPEPTWASLNLNKCYIVISDTLSGKCGLYVCNHYRPAMKNLIRQLMLYANSVICQWSVNFGWQNQSNTTIKKYKMA